MKTLCEQYNKAKKNKQIFLYESKLNRWLSTNKPHFKNFAKLLINFNKNKLG